MSLGQPLASSSNYNISRPPNLNPNLPRHFDFHLILQQQQTMLLKVMQQQETILEQQGQFKDRLMNVEQAVENVSASRAHNKPEQHKKARLTSDLTVRNNAIGYYVCT